MVLALRHQLLHSFSGILYLIYSIGVRSQGGSQGYYHNMRRRKKMKEEIIEQIKKEALDDHIPIIMDESLMVMDEVVAKRNKPFERILEIGTAVGYSAICFSKFLSENGKIDTIERDGERVQKAKENVQTAGLEQKIQIYEGDAVELLPTLNDTYDMVFIDAAKGKYPIFLQEACRMLKPDGIIFADNVLYKGYVRSDYNKHKQRTAVRHLREFLAEVENPEKYHTEVLEVGDGLAIVQLKR